MREEIGVEALALTMPRVGGAGAGMGNASLPLEALALTMPRVGGAGAGMGNASLPLEALALTMPRVDGAGVGMGNASLPLEAMALTMPRVDGHPNRRDFRGVLTLADAPSDRAPSGARGHRVMLTAQATERALPSLLGMAVDYTPELDRHDTRRKVGIITAADLRATAGRAQKVDVRGYLFARDFPEVVHDIRKRRSELGMSYEIADVRVVDTDAPIWVATDFKFTGAAVLLREKAAYEETSVELE